MNFETNIPNLVINASAGCGKTEILALRLLGLWLCESVKPESVVAMSFTRAAAGEIYERLVNLLAKATSSSEEAAKMQARLQKLNIAELADPAKTGLPKLQKLLRFLVDHAGDLKIATLDSFFASIVQTYPVELGLPGNYYLLSDGEEAGVKRQTLVKLILQDAAERKMFVETYQESVAEQEHKSIADNCLDMLKAADEYFAWRNHPEVWSYWCNNLHFDSPTVLQAAKAQLAGRQWNNDGKEKSALHEAIPRWADATENTHFLPKDLELAKVFWQNWQDFCNNVCIPGFKNKPIDPADQLPLQTLLTHVAKIKVWQAARRTAQIQVLYQHYQKFYQRKVIAQGGVTFADIPRLLTTKLLQNGEFFWDLAYRLNGELGHWLLDEFQDTSQMQLELLNPIIDEVDGVERSLFVVGDVKQAIYGWRGGDRRLLKMVAERYDLQPENLQESFRYGQNICTALNTLFGADGLAQSKIPEQVKKDFGEVFPEHKSHCGSDDQFEAILPVESENCQNIAPAARLIGRKLLALKPWTSGLTSAILVGTNKYADELRAEIVRQYPELHGQLVCTQEVALGNDLLVAACLQYLIYLQHPGDTLAYQAAMAHLALQPVIGERGRTAAAARELSLYGFEKTLLQIAKNWRDEMIDTASQNNFSTLLAAAAQFDGAGRSRDAVDFCDFASAYQQSGSVLEYKTRVMTLHKSKGLGFDVVITACATQKNDGWAGLGDSKFLKSPNPNDFWLLHKPGVEALAVPGLVEAYQAALNDKIFDDLCDMYVSLTRAKKYQLLVLPTLSLSQSKKARDKRGTIYRIYDWLEEVLDVESHYDEAIGGYRVGWGECHLQAKTAKPVLPALTMPPTAKKFKHQRCLPSATEEVRKLVFELPRATRGTQFGEAVHDFFAKIDDLSACVVPEGLLGSHVQKCRQNPAVVALLSRAANREIWQERAYEVILPDAAGREVWSSGRFDRVQLDYDAAGKLQAATIIDYKSNYLSDPTQIAEAAKPYQKQLALYRRVLAQMTNLAPEQIQTVLLFTGLGELYYCD